MKKERGSALIIAMLMIAAIAGIAFGIARLLFVETASAARYENGAVAYYAAESGLEEGFLRYKIDQNSEIPKSFSLATPSNVYRTNLSGNSVSIGTSNVGIDGSTSISASDNTNQYYDLRMGYIGTKGYPFLGIDGDGDHMIPIHSFTLAPGYETADPTLRIKEDQSFKVTLSGYDFFNNDLDMGLKFISTSDFDDTDQCKALAEIKFTVNHLSPASVKEYKAMLIPTEGCKSIISSSISDVGLMVGLHTYFGGSTDSKAYYVDSHRIQQVIDTIGKGSLPSTSDKVILSIKPLNYDAAIAMGKDTGSGYTCDADLMTPSSCSTKADVPAGPYSYISSTGHYAGISKTLEANLDRQSGTVYDLYDFVLFKGK